MTTTVRDEAGTPRGIYGLQLDGIVGSSHLLRVLSSDWPTLRIAHQAAVVTPPHHSITHERAELRLQSGGSVVVDRRTMVATFRSPHRLTAEAIVHPFLAGPAAVACRWLGRQTFHAGAFATSRGAWAMLGHKRSGKSSALGSLALQGVGVVTDDLLVVDDGSVLAGPSCVDLRADASRRLGAGADLGAVGARERWRLVTAPVPVRLPLLGWVFLEWAEELRLSPLPPASRIVRLFEHLALRIPPDRPAAFLDLAALPCFELRRPRRWDALRSATDLLLDKVA